MVNGRLFRISFDWDTPAAATISEYLSQKKTKTIATRIYDAIEKDKQFIAKIQKKKSRDVNAHRREIDFEVEDKI
jgi:tRNA A22 N-methylase